MKGRIAYMRVYKCLSVKKRLHGKAAERAVLTARLTGITMLQLQSPLSTFIVK